ncbi:hypothetical protein CAC42_1981 [Sphaceloma murrayae]|uniref:Uncharacterized protein n=1 Tax=Sphaceloma murrayae TaxID=2082308 RepID=A0A2K1QIN5_9PEZI|nr:hypothetical protein CAC42_1981 [Sphaceloma murrayae]
MIPSLRGGMQVHAVPDNEKAFDANGKRLPWAYEYADADTSRGRPVTEERGPFGRSTRRRGFSRSKTTTPANPRDTDRVASVQAEDAIFNTYKATQRTRDALATSKSAPLISHDANVNTGTGKPGMGQQEVEKEATEVIFYGYGSGQEWAAIDFYERVSGGAILEDYDRVPPHTRYDPALSLSRAKSQRSLSKAALAKRNRYNGGLHWIKVTFDSHEAADLACDRSPHTLRGYLVYAEPYRGVGPPKDAAIPCSQAGAMLDGDSLPATFSSKTASRMTDTATESPESSQTVSSATIGEPIRMRDLRAEAGLQVPRAVEKSVTMPSLSTAPGAWSVSIEPVLQSKEPKQRPPRIQGAKRAVLKPAEQALMPTSPKYTGILAVIPFLGLLFGSSKADSSGSTIPKLENGEVDWNNAGLYWLFFAWLDGILGTDMCGLRGEE